MRSLALLLLAALPLVVVCPSAAAADKDADKDEVIPYESGVPWAAPEMVTPGGSLGDPPSDAIVLLDGTNLDAWDGDTSKWQLRDGYAVAGSRIQTKQAFGDCQLHVEFLSPESESGDQGQKRGNNGIGLMGAKYELQVLDSHSSSTYPDGQASAVYKQRPPMVNASRPTGQWQTYDIVWTAPAFNEEGSLKSPAAITVLHNGVVTQNHYELTGEASYIKAPVYSPHPEKLPLVLMFHGDPVHFRNIWIRDLSGDAGTAQLAPEDGTMTAEDKTAADESGDKAAKKAKKDQ